MESQEVVIVGAGVIGLNIAYELAKSKIGVTVVDQFVPFKKSSWAGAGIIPPGNPAQITNPREWLRAKSATLYPLLSQELLEFTKINNGYLNCGGLELTHAFDQNLENAWTKENIKFTRIGSTDLNPQFPHLGSIKNNAYFFPEMAQIRNPRHLKALTEACRLLGVRFYNDCKITGILKKDSKVIGLKSEIGLFTASHFIIASGAWSGTFITQENIPCDVFPVMGQMLLLQTSAKFQEIILKGKNYIVPRGDGLVLIGSTEENVGFNPEISNSGREILLNFAVDLVPELGQAKIIDHWAGLRPGRNRPTPLIGKSPSSANLYFATGHFRQGLQTSPATALFIKSLICGEKTELDSDYFMQDKPIDEPYKQLFQS